MCNHSLTRAFLLFRSQHFIARECIPSPRSSYDYNSDSDLDDEVTQAMSRDNLARSNLAETGSGSNTDLKNLNQTTEFD